MSAAVFQDERATLEHFASNSATVNVALHGAGLPLVKLNGKKPQQPQWQTDLKPSRKDVAAWGSSNVGTLATHFPGIDVDVARVDLCSAIEHELRALLSARGHVLKRIGRPPRFLIPTRLAPGAAPFPRTRILLLNADGTHVLNMDGKWAVCEILGNENQWVANGIHPDTLAPYEWSDGVHSGDASLLAQVGPDGLPASDLAFVCGPLLEAIQRAVSPFGIRAVLARSAERKEIAQPLLLAPSIADAVAVVDAMPNNIESHPAWLAFLAALKGSVGVDGDAEGEEAWVRWNDKYEGVHKRDPRDTYRTFNRPVEKGWRDLLDFAAKAGVNVASYVFALPPLEAPTSRARTDLGNAERFADAHRDKAVFVAEWGKWVVWDGTRWVRDTTRAVERLGHETARSIHLEAFAATDAAQRKALAAHAVKSEGRWQINAMVQGAAAILHAMPSMFDTDPMLYNVQNGTIDLRSGTLRAHDRTDLLTKMAPVTYDPAATCPLWMRFVREAMCGDESLVEYVQTAAGYSLSGDVREQCFFLLHGDGSTGKSTVLDILLALSGDYGATAAFTTFMDRKHTGGPRNDVATLAGYRFVTSIEANKGHKLDEALTKQLTGGDRIAERKLYQEAEAFYPQLKLWLATNYKPTIEGTDDGIWRRMRLIPFLHKVPPHERDMELKAKLRAELPGILNWVLQGTKRWLEHGLPNAAAVVDATAEYRQTSDTLGLFLEQCCEVGPSFSQGATELYHAYRAWGGGVRTETQASFGRDLTARGFTAAQTSKREPVRRVGLRLIPQATTDPFFDAPAAPPQSEPPASSGPPAPTPVEAVLAATVRRIHPAKIGEVLGLYGVHHAYQVPSAVAAEFVARIEAIV